MTRARLLKVVIIIAPAILALVCCTSIITLAYIADAVVAGLVCNDSVNSLEAPSMRYVVRIHERNCGATTGFSTDVTMCCSTSVVAYDAVFRSSNPIEDIKVQFVDTNHLTIHVRRPHGVTIQLDRWNDIDITYSFDSDSGNLR